MHKISIPSVNKIFSRIAETSELYLPTEDETGKGSFARYSEGTEYGINLINTVDSPRKFFFPQVDRITAYSLRGKSIDVCPPTPTESRSITKSEKSANSTGDVVIFGVRACDEKSFHILDRVFLSSPEDDEYKSRREKSTVITRACNEPEETCFCTTFGIEPWNPKGDGVVWTDDNYLYFKSITDKGRRIENKLSDIMEYCADSETDTIKNNIKSICNKLPIGILNLDYWRSHDEKEIFSSPVWDELYSGCLGCGACTFVCPTCQCYDIRDYDNNGDISRFRCWDSCMYSDFTKMAHGNPRKTQKERFRQRFMHKLKYFPLNNDGEFSCVGCGRCITSCPQSLNIVKGVKTVNAFNDAHDTPDSDKSKPDLNSFPSADNDEYESKIVESAAPDDVSEHSYQNTVGYIKEIRLDTPDVKTFTVVGKDGKKCFEHMPGQCAMLSIPGAGEAMFSITSSPTNKDFMEFSIKKCGSFTSWLHMAEPGQEILIRGPYGNHFPVESELKNKDLLFIAGGIGLAPLRSVINYCRDNRDDYGKIDIVYGSRSMDDLVDYKEINEEWAHCRDTNVHLTIDREQQGWDGHVGFVPDFVKELNFDTNKTVLLCGPPVMIKFTLQALTSLGFDKTQVYTTMELKMKCGVGKCGRCNIGSKYVCKDGPVFRCDELETLPDEY